RLRRDNPFDAAAQHLAVAAPRPAPPRRALRPTADDGDRRRARRRPARLIEPTNATSRRLADRSRPRSVVHSGLHASCRAPFAIAMADGLPAARRTTVPVPIRLADSK